MTLRHQDLPQSVDSLATEAIGAAIEVHRHLGPGFLESVYHEAMRVELRLRGIAYESEYPVKVEFKNHPVGEGRIDLFLSTGPILLELKTVDALHPVHKAQVISYLKATGCRLGLLMNFRSPTFKEGLVRVVL